MKIRFGRLILMCLRFVGVLTFVALITSVTSTTSKAEYDFSWLDPDKKIYVIQNRKYLKAKRALVSVLGGLGLSNPYRTTYNVSGRAGYYITEQFGLEGFYTASFNSSNNTYKALINSSSTALPVVREVAGEWGVLGHWVPWYAKINIFNTIFYFDWYFALGAGQILTDLDTNTVVGGNSVLVRENFTALFVGTGHHYHIDQNFTVRLDFLGAYYQAPLFGQVGEKSWFSNYNFSLGLGFRL